MADVFISYKQDERERMRPIADGLRQLGVDVWFDERLMPDRAFTEEIQHLLQVSKAQVVCWSPAAVASEWVRGEADKGRQRGALVSIIIEPCDLPPPFNMYHAENLSAWTGDPTYLGWRKVLDAVGARIGRPGLGEFAALQRSSDAAEWKKWAQKYPDDAEADTAWAKAEDLAIATARQKIEQEKEQAKAQAARQAERKRNERVAPPPSRPAARPEVYSPPREERRGGGAGRIVMSGAGVLLVAGALFYFGGGWSAYQNYQRTQWIAPLEGAWTVVGTSCEFAVEMRGQDGELIIVGQGPQQVLRREDDGTVVTTDQSGSYQYKADGERLTMRSLGDDDRVERLVRC